MKRYKVSIDECSDLLICEIDNSKIKIGDIILVRKEKSLFIGHIVKEDTLKKEKCSCEFVRQTTDNDIKILECNKKDAIVALEEAKKIVKKLNVDMSLITAYYTFDRKQLFFVFVADTRIDFRQLAKKLAEKYKTRIELRQIGIRDKAKKIGGIGPCGLFLCCNRFLTDFNSVSINMAKNQFLALNPSKINGLCGRLLCCLNYEDDLYKELKEGMPKIGSFYSTEKGKGKVIGGDVFKGTIDVQMEDRSIVTLNYRNSEENGSIE